METQTQQRVSQFWMDLKLLLTGQEGTAHDRLYSKYKIVGVLYFPAFWGALMGFRWAYNRLDLKNKQVLPNFDNQPTAVYTAMVVGAFLYGIAPILIVTLFLAVKTAQSASPIIVSGFFLWMLANGILCMMVTTNFKEWRIGQLSYLQNKSRHGTARFATQEDKLDYAKPLPGFFIGEGLGFHKSGHLLTVAGTRGGKGVNLIIPNLLPKMAAPEFDGSWVIIDPKGENAAITARIQREAGKKVVIINPWNLLDLKSSRFNPLAIISNDPLNFSDDVGLLAEAIVPMKADRDDHFDNRARTFIKGLLMQLLTDEPVETRHLGTLWEWLRLGTKEWGEVLGRMSKNNSHAGSMVRSAFNEIVALRENSEREYGSIMSTTQKHTDFLTSPALRENLKNSYAPGVNLPVNIGDLGTFNHNSGEAFDPSDLLDDKKTVVYVVIPAERLRTHSQWLRIVVSSLLRSVVRQKLQAGKSPRKVCFMLDEAYALGYQSDIAVGLGMFAGMGVHIWSIYQNLIQIADTYGRDNWENFIASCSVRHFFNIADNFSGEYISRLMGDYSVSSMDTEGNISGSTSRRLINADELRQDGDTMFTILEDKPPMKLAKLPYYTLGLDHDPNPYVA